ncbi:MAG: RDD family protein [Candidatus Nanopelagicales bacterium]
MSDDPQPAGWYPDPDGQRLLRYWDGAVWTSYFSRRRVQATSSQEFWRRTGGFIVDCLILTIAFVPIAWSIRLLPGEGSIWAPVLNGALVTFIWFVYEYATVVRWSATPGMRFVGICLESSARGRPQSAAMRAAVFAVLLGAPGMLPGASGQGPYLVGSVIFLLSSLSVFWSPNGAAWHDRFSGTTVVRANPEAPTRTRRIIGAAAALGLVVYVLPLVVSAVLAMKAIGN